MSSAGSRRPTLPFGDRTPVPVLDQVRHDLSRADVAFGPISKRLGSRRGGSDEQLRQAAAERDMLAAELDARGAALEARVAEVQQLQKEQRG